MKQQRPVEPLRGEAAYRAHKAEVARRNELARADGAAQRAARQAGIAARQLQASGWSGRTTPANHAPDQQAT
jgi:hypothetical protein